MEIRSNYEEVQKIRARITVLADKGKSVETFVSNYREVRESESLGNLDLTVYARCSALFTPFQACLCLTV